MMIPMVSQNVVEVLVLRSNQSDHKPNKDSASWCYRVTYLCSRSQRGVVAFVPDATQAGDVGRRVFN